MRGVNQPDPPLRPTLFNHHIKHTGVRAVNPLDTGLRSSTAWLRWLLMIWAANSDRADLGPRRLTGASSAAAQPGKIIPLRLLWWDRTLGNIDMLLSG